MLKSIEDYNQLDANFSQESFSYKGIDVGYLFRNHLVSKVRSKHNVGNSRIKLTAGTYVRLLYSVLRTLPSLLKKKSIWVFSNAERRKRYNGNYVDRVASIVSEVHKSVLYIENPVLVHHKYPTNDTVVSDAVFFLFSYIVGFLSYDKRKLLLPDQFYHLARQYGVTVNPHAMMRRFWGQYSVMCFFLKFIYKPQKVYVVYPSGYNGYVRAFKDYNIPIIELQHGVIYPTHPSYNFAYNPIGQYFYPDHVFVYGHKDRERLGGLAYVKIENIHVVGSYGLWFCKNRLKINNPYLEEIVKSEYEKIILITATNDDLDLLYEFGRSLALQKADFGIFLLPRTGNNDLYSADNLIVLDNTQVNVFELYKIADYHLTQNSTCALEALYMDIPSFVLEVNRATIFSRSYQFITALNFVKTVSELVVMIDNCDYRCPNEDDISHLFENHVLKSFQTAEKKIEHNEL